MPWFSDHSDVGDHARSRRFPGCPPFFTLLLKTNLFPRNDPWVTPRFPLGHPDFSTGSPNVLLGSPKPHVSRARQNSRAPTRHPEQAAALAASEGPESREAHPNYLRLANCHLPIADCHPTCHRLMGHTPETPNPGSWPGRICLAGS